MTNHTKDLDNLIWQGSQISSRGKLFLHSELKTNLKVLDQRWQTSRTKVEERLVALQSVQDDFTDKELRFLEVSHELDKIGESVRQEQLSEERTKEKLETFWEIYEVGSLKVYSLFILDKSQFLFVIHGDPKCSSGTQGVPMCTCGASCSKGG